MRKILLLFLFPLLLIGCIFTSRPPNNAGFGDSINLHDLEGIYQNLGERKPGASPFYLSAIIWPKAEDILHEAVETVEIKVSEGNKLIVKAHRNNGVEKEDTFVEGKDFKFRSGRILLQRGFKIAGFEDGVPALGPYYERIELGIDKTGQGKYEHRVFFAGLAFLVMPVALGESEDVRFIKIDRINEYK